MTGILVDSNVILDIFEDDPVWYSWSEAQLEHYGALGALYINPIIYAEISIGFLKIEDVEEAIALCGFDMLDIPKAALFDAGKASIAYRKRGGSKTSPLPDFFIGAHAEASNLALLTRDAARYATYFPAIPVDCPINAASRSASKR